MTRNRFYRLLPICAVVLTGLFICFLSSFCQADDWPSYRGTMRDGVSRETGLLQSWPEDGPNLLWQFSKLGNGFGAPSIVADKLYINGHLKGMEYLICLNAETGKPIWATPVGPAKHPGGGTPGARSTPTVHRDMVYTLGIMGDLVACDAGTGRVIWRRNLVRQFGGVCPKNGYSESPLVDGKWIVFCPGGKSATVCALFRVNGQPVFLSGMRPWRCATGDPAGYASIVKASIGGQQQYLVQTANGLLGVRVRGGDLLWRYDDVRANELTPLNNTPIWYAQTVFQTGPENSAMLWPKKAESGSTFNVNEIYKSEEFKVPFLSAIRVNDMIFGGLDEGQFACAGLKDGKIKWSTEKCGQDCSCTYADGMLYVRNIKGGVSLVSATDKDFACQGRFVLPGGPKRAGFAAPVIANGRMYVRDQSFLFCYDVSKAGIEPPGPVRKPKKAKKSATAGPAMKGEISDGPEEEPEPATKPATSSKSEKPAELPKVFSDDPEEEEQEETLDIKSEPQEKPADDEPKAGPGLPGMPGAGSSGRRPGGLPGMPGSSGSGKRPGGLPGMP